jgi:hypothetical protein
MRQNQKLNLSLKTLTDTGTKKGGADKTSDYQTVKGAKKAYNIKSIKTLKEDSLSLRSGYPEKEYLPNYQRTYREEKLILQFLRSWK